MSIVSYIVFRKFVICLFHILLRHWLGQLWCCLDSASCRFHMFSSHKRLFLKHYTSSDVFKFFIYNNVGQLFWATVGIRQESIPSLALFIINLWHSMYKTHIEIYNIYIDLWTTPVTCVFADDISHKLEQKQSYKTWPQN